MNEKNISTMLKEILTLRYYPSLDINTKKYGSTDFEPKNSPNYLDHIEKLILNAMKNEIHEKKVSVALSGGVDSTLLLGLLRKALPDIEIEAISVKYADSVDESNPIRSAFGGGANVYTTLGPLSFVLAQSLTKGNLDETERFNFRLGTSF